MIKNQLLGVAVAVIITLPLSGCRESPSGKKTSDNSQTVQNAGKVRQEVTAKTPPSNIVEPELPEPQQIIIPEYSIVSIRDVSFSTIKRYDVRVRVGHMLSRHELELVSQAIVKKLKETKPHNALTLFYYLPDSDTDGLYTAGKAVWAPYGDWARVDEVHTGKYSKHSLKLSPGNTTGWDPEKVKVPEISLGQKKRIFFELVKAQDSGIGDNEAYGIIAKKFNVDETTVRKIAIEGIANGWPMP